MAVDAPARAASDRAEIRSRRAPRRFTPGVIATIVVLALCVVVEGVPFLFMIAQGLKSNADVINHPLGIPHSLHFGNIVDAWNGGGTGQSLGRAFANSLLVTAATVIVVGVCASLAGYALASLRLPGARWITQTILLLVAIPVQATLLPVFYTLGHLGLRNNYLGLILVYSAFWLPFSILITRAGFRTFPRELIEAGRADGASEVGIFFRIVLPAMRGPIVGVSIVNGIGIWSELLFAFVLMSDPSKRTLPAMVLAFQGQFTADYRLLYASLIIAALPPLLFYALFSRQIRKGMMAGSFR